MTTSSMFDLLMERVTAGDRLGVDDLAQLAATPDILQLGMLADAVRRRIHGAQVTYVRVALCPFDKRLTDVVPLQAREVRLQGSPQTLEIAVTAVQAARAVAGERTVSAFSWLDIDRLSASSRVPDVLERLRPWRFSSYRRRAKGLIELPAGTVRDTGTRPGDTLSIADQPRK